MFYSVAFVPLWPQEKEQNNFIPGKRGYDVGKVIAA